jgi:dTDP-4-amino-4,6-dideoxygalactose transaminase
VQAALSERGIATGVHYPIPIHLQRAYADLGLGPGSFERTERSAHRLLSLPMFAELTEDQIVCVVDALASCRPLLVA